MVLMNQVRSTKNDNEGTEENFESTKEQREGTEEKVESTKEQREGTEDQTKEEVATQASQTSSQTPTSMIFGQMMKQSYHFSKNMKSSQSCFKEKEKDDPKDKGKKRIEEEDNLKVKMMLFLKQKATNEALIKNFDDKKGKTLRQTIFLLEASRARKRAVHNRRKDKVPSRYNCCCSEKFLAQTKNKAIEKRPPTKKQLKKSEKTYLKHVGTFKHLRLKSKKFKNIQAMYEKIKRTSKEESKESEKVREHKKEKARYKEKDKVKEKKIQTRKGLADLESKE
ncbi:hypothetical protein Tco_0906472 [Tanacetum coccineum]|uniref:Uncharacterized protein n=1 Tax=Tanacetum coccineum TaxID=301880 RepID=A0ABQ5CI22_9ASTR